MAWLVLIVAGLFEVLWASLLPATRGLTRPLPTLGFLASLGASMYLLANAVRHIPIGTAYAVWVGIGAVGTFVVGAVVKGDSIDLSQAVAVAFLVLSIIAVKMTTG